MVGSVSAMVVLYRCKRVKILVCEHFVENTLVVFALMATNTNEIPKRIRYIIRDGVKMLCTSQLYLSKGSRKIRRSTVRLVRPPNKFANALNNRDLKCHNLVSYI